MAKNSGRTPAPSGGNVELDIAARAAAQAKRGKRKLGPATPIAPTPTSTPVETRICGCCKSDTAVPALYGFVAARANAEGNLPSRQQVLECVVCAGCRPETQFQENLAATIANRAPRQLLSCERVLASIAEQRRQAQIAKAEAARSFIASTSPATGLMALAALAEAKQVSTKEVKA